MTTTTRDKLLPGSYRTYPMNLPDQRSGRYTEKAGGTPTYSGYRKRIQTEDRRFLTNYQLNTSTIAGTVSIGTKPSNNTSLATKNYYLTGSEAYGEDNLQQTNQDHLPSHLLLHLLENHSRPEQPFLKEFTAYSLGPLPIPHHCHHR